MVSLIAFFGALGALSYALVAVAAGPASAGKAQRTGWTITTLAPRTWWTTSAIDINDHGQIIGQGYSAPDTWHSFLWQNGKLRDLGTLGGDTTAAAINERGQVVGSSYTDRGEDAFVWRDGRMTARHSRRGVERGERHQRAG